MSEESERALRHRTEQLALLAEVEAFKVLKAQCEKRAEDMSEQLLKWLLAPGPTEPLNQRLIDYNRGIIMGMKYATTDVPSEAARRLQRFEQGARQETEPEEDYWSYEQPGD